MQVSAPDISSADEPLGRPAWCAARAVRCGTGRGLLHLGIERIAEPWAVGPMPPGHAGSARHVGIGLVEWSPSRSPSIKTGRASQSRQAYTCPPSLSPTASPIVPPYVPPSPQRARSTRCLAVSDGQHDVSHLATTYLISPWEHNATAPLPRHDCPRQTQTDSTNLA